VLVDPLNAQFGGLPATSINLASAPYSITLVDTFTVEPSVLITALLPRFQMAGRQYFYSGLRSQHWV